MSRLRRMGSFMSQIILPNIGAFITWGLITALFIPTGWYPNAELAQLVTPMARYLLPLLIGYSGGRLVYDTRGGVIGAAVTIGMIVGSDVPMFAGAMLVGPLSGYLLKKIDHLLKEKIPMGFEMLINNFSAGLMGLILTIVAFKVIGPMMNTFNIATSDMLKSFIENNVIAFSSIVIEPAKVLFLNNIINHGVLSPMGLMETAEVGKSILFLLETNPGPGLGILLAYWVFGDGIRKHSAPGAIVIHFFGGIHEVYFPYVLANPLSLIPVIVGGFAGNMTFQLLGVGLTATPSPGSIFSIMALAPKGDQFGILLGVLLSAGVSFLLAAFFVRKHKEESLEVTVEHKLSCIAFACDAGMGSSVMAATKFEMLLNNKDIKVIHCPVDDIPNEVDFIITHELLIGRIAKRENRQIIGVKDLLNSPEIKSLLKTFQHRGGEIDMFFKKDTGILREARILTGLKTESKIDAINRAGEALVSENLVESAYVLAMQEREEIATTYIGSNVAIPHGTNASKVLVKETGIVILQYPEGVDFGDGNIAKLVIGIAASGDEHMDILMQIAEAVSNKETLDYLTSEPDAKKIYKTFVKSGLGGQS